MLFSRRPVDSLESVLATCLDDLEAGLLLEEILARYPQYAADLAPLLAVAVQMRSAPWPSLSARGRLQGREQMHAALAQYHAGFSRWRPSWAQAAMALIIVASVSAASIVATQQGRSTPIESTPMSAPATAAAAEHPALAPENTATATSTTEPSATPTLETATATSTLTATSSVNGKLGTLLLPSPSAQPSATASPRVTTTLPLTLTVTPTGTLVMRSNQMPQPTLSTDTTAVPTVIPTRTSNPPTLTPVPTTRAPGSTATTAPVPTVVVTLQPKSPPPPTARPPATAAPSTAQPTSAPPFATSPVNISPVPRLTPQK